MASNSETLRIILQAVVRGASNLQKMRKSLEGVGAGAEKAAGAFDLLKRGAAVLETLGAGYMLKKVADLGVSLYSTGVEAERARLALEAYAGNSFRAARAVQEVQEATDGLVDKLTAAQMATKLFAMGLARNEQEAARLARMAVMLGAAVGKDAYSAFEDFTLLLSNQSIQRLDNFGISSTRVRERIAELQREMDGLDRQTAFVIAVMEEGDRKLRQLGDAGFQAGHEIDRLKSRLRDLWVENAEQFAAGANGLIDGITAVRQAIEEQNKRLVEGSQNYADYVEKFLEWKRTLPAGLQMVTQQMSQARYEQEKLLVEGSRQVDGWASALTGGMQRVQEGAADTRDAISGIRIEWGKLDRELVARRAIAALTQQLNEGQISLGEFRDKAYYLLRTFADMSHEEASARINLAELNSELEAGKMTPLEYALAARELVDALDELPRSVRVDINLVTHGSIPRIAGQTGRVKLHGEQFGGPVLPGMPYLVGERHPETFVPRERGRVEPTVTGTAQPVSITIHTNGPVSPVDITHALQQARYMGLLQ